MRTNESRDKVIEFLTEVGTIADIYGEDAPYRVSLIFHRDTGLPFGFPGCNDVLHVENQIFDNGDDSNWDEAMCSFLEHLNWCELTMELSVKEVYDEPDFSKFITFQMDAMKLTVQLEFYNQEMEDEIEEQGEDFYPTDHIKYPDIKPALIGGDGNSFVILAKVRESLTEAKVPATEIAEFLEEAMSSDYNHLLATVTRWVNVGNIMYAEAD